MALHVAFVGARPASFALLVVVLLIASFSSSQAQQVINICLSTTYQPAQSLRASLSAEARRGFSFLQEWIDAKPGGGFMVGNLTYRFNFTYAEDNSNQTRMIGNYRRFINDSNCHFLFGPQQSDFSIAAAAAVTEPANRLLLAHNAASDAFNLGRNKAFSIMPAASRYLTAAFVEMRVRDVKNISVAMAEFPHQISSCAQLPTKLAPDYGVKVASFHVIPENPIDYVMDPASVPNITATAEAIMKVNADAVILCSFSSNNKFMVDYWKSKNWLPKLVIINGIGILPYLNWTNKEYVSGVESWDASSRYPRDKFFGTMEDLLALWQARFPSNPLVFASMNALYTGIALMEAIQRAGTLNEDAVTFSLSRLDIDTLKGRIAWSGDRTQLGLAVFLQTLNGEWKTVGPIAAKTNSDVTLIYPVPQWNEREYVSRPYTITAEHGVTVLFAIGIVSNVIFMIGLVYHWNHPVVRAASPVFLALVLLGTSILYSAIWVWMPSLVNAASCHLRFWMLVVGFGLTFGSLFSKTWRIWTLWNNSNTKGVFAITDLQLTLIVLIVVGIEMVLCILVSAIANPSLTFVVRDLYRPSTNIPICSSGTAQLVLVIVLAVYNALIILYGIYLAIRVRVIPFSQYNESKIIGFSIYNAAFFTIIMFILQASDATDRTALFVLMSFALFFGSFGTTVPLFISKFMLIRNPKMNASPSSSKMAGSTPSATRYGSAGARPGSSVQSSTDDDNHASKDEKIAELRKKNKELRNRVKDLKQKLAEAKGLDNNSL